MTGEEKDRGGTEGAVRGSLRVHFTTAYLRCCPLDKISHMNWEGRFEMFASSNVLHAGAF